jgi:hypothetical protein
MDDMLNMEDARQTIWRYGVKFVAFPHRQVQPIYPRNTAQIFLGLNIPDIK